MADRDLVVVGASAGGVEALKALCSALPADLPATVLVALHLPSTARTYLAGILDRRCSLPVHDAVDGMRLEPGTVVVAQPDAHLLVVDGHVVLGRGARENGHRPSHDAMLRSAALARGERAVGIVLTGLLDDGAAGLTVVHRYGGACLVQSDAEFPSMPEHALAAVPTATCVPLAEMAQEVVRLVQDDSDRAEPPAVPDDLRALDQAELRSALGDHPTDDPANPVGEPSSYGCPDCHGVLNVIRDSGPLRFRCRTGHAWTAESLLMQQGAEVETALWTALRVLEERADMSLVLAQSAEDDRRNWSADHFRARAAEALQSADTLRALLKQEIAVEPITESTA